MRANLSVLKSEEKKIRKILYLFLLLVSISSCKEQKTEFIYLDKISTKKSLMSKLSATGYYIERVLIISPPKKTIILDSIILNYFYQEKVSFCSLNSSIDKYAFAFYEKTPCTSYFIENKQDKRHEIEGDRGCDDDLAMFYYHRSKENPNMWYASYPDNFKDTVYCDSLIIAPPFED